MILFHLLLALAPQEQVVTQERPQLLLFYSPACPHSRNVLEYLTRIKKTVPICNVMESKKNKDALMEQGGIAQVPCLMIDKRPLYDDQEIITWLSTHQDLLNN